jgi:peroxiredoxin
VEKSSYGRTSMGIKRSTFVVGADGNVVDAGYGVKPDTDARRVLDALPG